MAEFILTNLSLISAGLIIYLLIRALPRVDEKDIKEKGLIDKWISSGIPEKIDRIINSVLEKILRKIKVFLLKIDNLLSKRLQKIKDEKSSKESLIDEFKKLDKNN